MNRENTSSNPLVSGLHFRGKLPHWKREGATYFVTFRLADSLPSQEIVRLKNERLKILETARAHRRPLTWHEEQDLLAWYCDRVEMLLDSGQGFCFLRRPEIAELVTGALKFFNGERYDLRAWVIMPNHVHALVWPRSPYSLSKILHSWKSFTSNQANRILNRTGNAFWQAESFDHWIRDDAEHGRISQYIENNPVTARLCARADEWRWSSAWRQASCLP